MAQEVASYSTQKDSGPINGISGTIQCLPIASLERASCSIKSFGGEAKCFDPDIVDLRMIPNSRQLKARVRTSLNPAVVLAKADSVSTVERSWRSYDSHVKVSIVLPVYNGSRYLGSSIKSCLQQTHKNIELVVVDDCSTDNTPRIIDDYREKDRRIVSLRNDRNLRLPGALNVGFTHATGSMLTWTSHDNYYAPNAIQTLVEYLCTYPDVDFVSSAYYYVDEDDHINPEIVYLPPFKQLPTINTVGPCFLYRRKVYEAVGDFRAEAEYYEDHDYWLRVYRRFKMARLHMPLYYYRYHPDSMSAMRVRLRSKTH